MPQIPLSQRTQQAGVVSQPRGSLEAAAAPWRAVAQAGQVVGQLGRDIQRISDQQKLYDQKKAEATTKAQVADFNTKLDVRNKSMIQAMTDISDPVEAQEFYDSWKNEQADWAQAIEWATPAGQEKALSSLENTFLENDVVVLQRGGMIDNKEIKVADVAWIDMQQNALDGEGGVNPVTEEPMTPEAAYTYATDERLRLGTITPEQAAKGKRKFGQDSYFRVMNKAVGVNYEAAKEQYNPGKLSSEQQLLMSQRFAEADRKVYEQTNQVRSQTENTLIAEANRRELTLEEIEKVAGDTATVYGGVEIQMLSDEQAGMLKTIVSGNVAADKNSREYGRVWELISTKLMDGEIEKTELDSVLKTIRKAKFSSQTNLDLMNQIQELFGSGKFDPSERMWPDAFKMSHLHGAGIRGIVDAYKQSMGVMRLDDEQSFNALAGRMKSLLDLYAEKGSDYTADDYAEWRKNNMADVDLMNAENAQRQSAMPPRGEVAQEQADGRVAIFDAETKEFIRWQ